MAGYFSLKNIVDLQVHPLLSDLEHYANRKNMKLMRDVTKVVQGGNNTTITYLLQMRTGWFTKQKAVSITVKLHSSEKNHPYLGYNAIASDEGVVIELCEKLFKDKEVQQLFTDWFYRSRLSLRDVKHKMREVT